MGEKNGHVGNLFEDSWFFGNSLLCRSKSSKIMVRCNSDPCTSSSSSTKEEGLISDQDHPTMISSLLRTPSLPLGFGGEIKYQLGDDDNEEEDDDEEGPRMGDLIRQAMPLPKQMPRRRLDRTPSLPPCRGKEAVSTPVASTGVQSGAGVGRLSRRESLESSVMLQEKGPIAAMTKLTRRASIDSSMLLPPKSATTKGTKQSMNNSKNRPHRKLESQTINNQSKPDTKPEKIDKSKSQKSLSDLEVEELQGFKDLGFSFDNKELSPNVTQIIPALQRRASLGSSHIDIGKVRRPYLSESWQRTKSSSSTPPIPKQGDLKASSSDDMKAQIKFWARAVASNVRQEC